MIKESLLQFYNMGLDHALKLIEEFPLPQAIEKIKNLKEERKEKEELNPYDQFQLEKYGNVLPSNEGGVFENGTEEASRFSKWNHQMAEQQLLEHDRD